MLILRFIKSAFTQQCIKPRLNMLPLKTLLRSTPYLRSQIRYPGVLAWTTSPIRQQHIMLGGKGKTKKRRMTIHVNQIQRTTAAVSVWAAPALLMNFINEAPRRAIISWLEYLKESPFYQWCTEKKNLTSGRNLTELHVDLIRRINPIKPDIMQLFFERYQYKIYARVVYQRFWKSSVSTTHPAWGGGGGSELQMLPTPQGPTSSQTVVLLSALALAWTCQIYHYSPLTPFDHHQRVQLVHHHLRVSNWVHGNPRNSIV